MADRSFRHSSFTDSHPDFSLTISIPETELRLNEEGKQFTAYHVQIASHSSKTQRTLEWRVLRRYSEFLELLQQVHHQPTDAPIAKHTSFKQSAIG
jgi:hypothetical protein